MDQPTSPDPDSDSDGLAPFRTLDTSNRRSAALVYFVVAAFAASLAIFAGVHLMWLTAVLPLIGIGAYHLAAGRSMKVSDMQAIALASDAAPFDVGHASATLGFVGPKARPIWQVLVFEAGATPNHQAMITVDALSSEVTASYSEAVEPV